ncbi:MAG: hypothetical protein IPK79_06840 [Vampirovibrionales bacterium]|nr:hypothetical protein [Vampirovibrionales bacterium]
MPPATLTYLHTHWDREWYAPFREYQVRLADVVDAVLDRLDAGDLPAFTLDGQTCLLADYLELRPHQRERLSSRIHDGRLSVGPWFVAPDSFLVSGESLIRNLQRGLQEARTWGCRRFTGYLPDTFGHSGDMPTILQGFGLDSAMLWRGVNPSSALFWWESPSGARVQTLHLTDGYFQNMLHDPLLTQSERVDALRALKSKLAAAAAPYPALIPLGGDHLGPPSAAHWQLLNETLGPLETIHPADWFERLPPQAVRDDGPVISGELRDCAASFILPGVYSARMALKRENRLLEHRLARIAEPLAAITQLLTPPDCAAPFYHAEIAKAWELLLLNQAHDGIGGCSIDAVHRENAHRYEQAHQLLDAVAIRDARALDRIALQGVPADCWLIVNTGDRPYTGPVRVSAEGEAAQAGLSDCEIEPDALRDAYRSDFCDVPQAHRLVRRATGAIWAEDLPPFSATVLPKTLARKPPGDARILKPTDGERNAIENAFLRLSVREDGRIDVLDRQTQKLYRDLIRWVAQPQRGDAYNYRPRPDAPPVFWPDSSDWQAVTEQDAFCASLVLTSGALPFRRTRLTLTTQSPWLVMQTDIVVTPDAADWRDATFQASFETGAPLTTVTAESHLSAVSRSYDPAYCLQAQPPAEKGRELPTHTGPIQRFILANGQCWLVKGGCEYEIAQSRLNLTLFRTFERLSRDDTGARGAHAGPPLPTPEASNGAMTLTYAWAPTPTADDPVPWAYEAATRFYGVVNGWQGGAASLTRPPAAVSRSLLSWDNPAIVNMACVMAASSPRVLALRLLNVTSAPQTLLLNVGLRYERARWADLNHEPLADVSPVDLAKPQSFAPHALRTLLLEGIAQDPRLG